MFKEEFKKEGDEYKVIVSIPIRKYAIEKKFNYTSDPKLVIPEELRDKLELVSYPRSNISNQDKPQNSNVGVWVYKMKTTPQPRKTRSTKTRKTIDKN